MSLCPGEAGVLADAARLLDACRAAGFRLVTAESCTGGLIAAALSAIQGSSDVLAGGFVTYSNELKTMALGVPAGLIAGHGAVSAEVAEAMAAGALQRSGADLAVAVTGIAGPGGGSAEKPVGLVWLAICRRDGPATSSRHIFPGDRAAIRAAAAAQALRLLERALPA